MDSINNLKLNNLSKKITKQNFIILFLVSFISIKNAIQGAIIPIISEYYTSFNFILIITTLQFIIVFGIILMVLNIRSKEKFMIPTHFIYIILSGICSGMMAIFNDVFSKS